MRPIGSSLSIQFEARCWYLHNDVVDGDVDEFDKESNEAHDGKANCCCHGDFLEFCGQGKGEHAKCDAQSASHCV